MDAFAARERRSISARVVVCGLWSLESFLGVVGGVVVCGLLFVVEVVVAGDLWSLGSFLGVVGGLCDLWLDEGCG